MTERKKNKPFAKKSFGQNFLADPLIVRRIVAAVDPQADELVVEIGAGRGALTGILLQKAALVAAIELDKDLLPVLGDMFGENERFRLIHEDALKVDFELLIENLRTPELKKKAKLAANLPYNISTAILQRLTGQRHVFSEMFLMLQKEVVERITAEAGKKERGFLTVLIEAYFETEKLFDVPPNAFQPAPKVWSSVVRFTPKALDPVFENRAGLFRKLISAGFAQKRKTIYNNLRNADQILYKKDLSKILEESGIDPKRRAETLTIDEWLNLTGLLEK